MHSPFERIRFGSLFLALLLLASTLAIVASSDGTALASVPGTNGTIALERDGDIWTMEADGSGAALLYDGGAFPSAESAPAFSPDGSMIAFSSNRGVGTNANSQIWVMDDTGGSVTRLTTATAADSFSPSWSPDGNWIVFERLDPFTSSGTTTTGTAGTTLFDDAQTFDTDGVEAGMEITVDGKGTTTIASVESGTELTVAAGLSDDLAVGDTYTIKQDRYYLFLMDKDGNNLQNLSTGAGVVVPNKVYSDYAPKWSPDGDMIAFATGRNSSIASLANDIYVATVNPAVTPSLSGLNNLTPDPAWFDSSEEPEWSPDGTKLVFESQRAPGPGMDLWVMDEATGAAGPRVRLTNTTGIEQHPAWSPDGASIVFDEAGNLFSVPSAGGATSPLTSGATVDRQPGFDRRLVATDDTYPTTTGGTVTKDAADGVMANDVGLGGNPLAGASKVAGPTNGTLTFNADGSFTFTHDGSDADGSFTYEVTDAGGNISNTATVTIDTPSNAAPVANPNTYIVDAGGTLTVPAPGVLGNDTDAEDGVPGTAELETAPAHAVGTFVLNADGSFTYAHDGSAGTSDSFTYQAKDSFNKPSNVTTVTLTIKAAAIPQHSVGLVDPGSGRWYLYDSAGVQKTWFYFGNPGDYPIYGDWDGDGVETPGLYRQSDGYVYLRNSNDSGIADIKFFFGNPGDVPIAGDFNNDGFDTVSIYRPSNQTFYIINKLGSGDQGLGAADFSYVFGNPGDKPFVGDFDGDGVETAGLHRESTGLVYFRNSHTQGNADAQFIFGDPGDRLVAGDWNANGTFTPALFRPSNTTMYFRYTNTQGIADAQWVGGQATWLPVSGSNGLG